MIHAYYRLDSDQQYDQSLHIIGHSYSRHLKCRKHLINELKFLQTDVASAITRMRSGHDNYTYHKDKTKADHTAGDTCIYCQSAPETVEHILLHCQHWNQQRQALQDELSELEPKFNNNAIFSSVYNLLFPFQMYTAKEAYSTANVELRCQFLALVATFWKSVHT